jgi:peptidoglycan hydrolase CwlO-like protein
MKKIFTFLLILVVGLLVVKMPRVSAITCDDPQPTEKGQLEEFIKDCNSKLGSIAGQKQTLSQAISYLNTQIKLTQAKIANTTTQLEKLNIEIEDLTGRIESIDYSLDDLTKLFISRVRESYMRPNKFDTAIIAQSSGLPDILRNVEYTKKIRDHDRSILISLEKSRLDASAQKELKETKQKEIELLKSKLDADQAALNGQIASKNKLLADTKNSESVYQNRLAEAQAELVAIAGIINGLGVEVKVGEVGEGARIASIIQGRSPCSSGTHLHLEVAQNSQRRNPFELLRNTNLIWDNADPAQNGTGSWNWPLNDPIRITQGYGHTTYSSIYANNVHTGVDMVGDNSTVKAVKAGELYQGSMKCGSGKLVYVRVKHPDNFDTYYLHVNY